LNAYIINMKKKTKIFRIFHIIYDKFFANSKYQKKGGKKNVKYRYNETFFGRSAEY